MAINGQIKATTRAQHHEAKEWHSIRGTELSGGSSSYLGERDTDSYEFVRAVNYTKDKNTVLCTTDEAVYVVQKREDDRWFSIAKIVAYGYIIPD